MRLEGWMHGTDSRPSFETPRFARLLRMRAGIAQPAACANAGSARSIIWSDAVRLMRK
jgi:hypothetical protein